MNNPSPPTDRDETVLVPAYFWWQKCTSAYLHTITRQYAKSHLLPAMRPHYLQGAYTLVDKESPLLAQWGPRLGHPMMRSMLALDHKLVQLLASTLPHPHQAVQNAPQDRVTAISPNGFSFRSNQPDLKPGDCLEAHFGLFSDAPVFMRCFARIERLFPPNAQGARLAECLFARIPRPVDPNDANPPALRAEMVPLLAEPAPLPRMAVTRERPAVTPTPETMLRPPPREEKMEEQPGKRSLKRQEPLFDTVDLPPSKPGESDFLQQPPAAKSADDQPMHLIIPDEPSAASVAEANRRRDFRVNDEIPFAWLQVSEEDFRFLETGFLAYQKRGLPLLPMEKEEQTLLDRIDERLAKARHRKSNAERYLFWYRHQLDLYFRRANFPEEQAHYLQMIRQLFEITDLLHEQRDVAPRILSCLNLIKRRAEQHRKSEWAVFSEPDPNKRQEEAQLHQLMHQETEKGLRQLEEVDAAWGKRLGLLGGELNAVNWRIKDRPEARDHPMDTLITYPVNISTTGIAFRTHRRELKVGHLLMVSLRLTADNETYQDFRTLAKVVMLKDPDPTHRIRVATMFTLQQAKLQEMLGAHITRRQREYLSGRVQVKGGA
ncbi:MAG: hypothetical protein HQL56_04155 [Magnetococcales bacterium]|nr:hypothetical protein [Magnetococcales bacterium]